MSESDSVPEMAQAVFNLKTGTGFATNYQRVSLLKIERIFKAPKIKIKSTMEVTNSLKI